MNFVFISPHFPRTYWQFCAGLRANGVRVFGIADCPYEELEPKLRESLTEYYRVNDLESYDEVFRAVAYFSFKYGKIDWLESNNEYWLEQDARLRSDFNITTGIKSEAVAAFKEKSAMKKYYAKGKVPTARQIKASEGREAVEAFVALTGYPLVSKPDNGVGAAHTYKIKDKDELDAFFEEHPEDYGLYVIEEFVTGDLVSFDAIINSKGEAVFESMSCFPPGIMDIVNNKLDLCYHIEKEVPKALEKVGMRTVKAFGVTSRFVHFEFFRLDRDREGLGKKGDYVGLEVNMRPPGGFTPDMMDYAHSTDVFKIWADMVAFDKCCTGQGEQYFCAFASRRDMYDYAHSHEDILWKWGDKLALCERMPEALSSAMGNQMYLARMKSREEMQEFNDYVLEKA